MDARRTIEVHQVEGQLLELITYVLECMGVLSYDTLQVACSELLDHALQEPFVLDFEAPPECVHSLLTQIQ